MMKFFERYKQSVSNQNHLYILAVLVLMLPNILLYITDIIKPVEVGAYFLLPLSCYMFLMLIRRKPGYALCFLSPLLIIAGTQLVLLYLFGGSVISVDMFLNFASANSGEAGELMSTIWPLVLLSVIIYVPFIGYGIHSIRNKERLSPRFTRIALITSFLFLAVGSVSAWRSYATLSHYKITSNVYPFNAVHNLNYAVQKLWKNRSYLENVRDFKFNAVKKEFSQKREIYVLVIGETSRAYNWSLYGYGRDTNPRLSEESNLLVYKDVFTQANITNRIVPIILSSASAENYSVIYNQKSLISAFKETGFKTYFLSNQTSDRSFIDYFAAEADSTVCIRYTNEGSAINRYDKDLLPILDQVIQKDSSNVLLVLHTYGSHFEYNMRYPKNEAAFFPDESKGLSIKNRDGYQNAYDNSILYTDDFLKRIIDRLRDSGTCSAMMYLSDHGEDIMDDPREQFLHCSPIPSAYQLYIPFVVWFSDSYKTTWPDKVTQAANHLEKPFSSNVVFHTFIEIGDIKTGFVDTTLSLVNSGFNPGPRTYINDKDQPVEIKNLGLKKEDLIILNERNLTY